MSHEHRLEALGLSSLHCRRLGDLTRFISNLSRQANICSVLIVVDTIPTSNSSMDIARLPPPTHITWVNQHHLTAQHVISITRLNQQVGWLQSQQRLHTGEMNLPCRTTSLPCTVQERWRSMQQAVTQPTAILTCRVHQCRWTFPAHSVYAQTNNTTDIISANTSANVKFHITMTCQLNTSNIWLLQFTVITLTRKIPR